MSKNTLETITASGSRNNPMWFFNPLKSTPNLPPMLASPIDNRVVGTLVNGIPLLYVLAQNPPISPITPPPRLISRELRERPALVISSHILSQVVRFLITSPLWIRMVKVLSSPISGKQYFSVFSSTKTAI